MSVPQSVPEPLPDGEIASDPLRIADGWERRFIADRARAEEALQLYRELGFEVVADPLTPEAQPEGCEECRLVALLGFRVLYTRKRADSAAIEPTVAPDPPKGGT